MYVCLSVMGLGLKYTGLCIVYIPFGTAAQDAITQWHEVEDSEDRRRRQNESRCMEDG